MLFEITCDIFLNNKQRYQWQHFKYFQIPWVPLDVTNLLSLLFFSSDPPLPSSLTRQIQKALTSIDNSHPISSRALNSHPLAPLTDPSQNLPSTITHTDHAINSIH